MLTPLEQKLVECSNWFPLDYRVLGYLVSKWIKVFILKEMQTLILQRI